MTECYECARLAELVAENSALRAKVDELENKTCKLVETVCYSNANELIHLLECSECGRTCEHVNGSYPRCPHCGAKAVE